MSVHRVSIQVKVFDVLCDGLGCYARFTGLPGQTPDDVRHDAKRVGWGRGTTTDVCPECLANPGVSPQGRPLSGRGAIIAVLFLGAVAVLPILVASFLR